MRAKIQFLRYIIEYIKGYRGEIDPQLINTVYYNQLEINARLKEEMNRKPDVTLMQVVEYYNNTPKTRQYISRNQRKSCRQNEHNGGFIGSWQTDSQNYL